MFLPYFIGLMFIYPIKTQECDTKYDIKLYTIIRAQASEKNGAEYIKRLDSSSLENCFSACCEHKKCTVGVYSSKREKACFLFNCLQPNVCNFTSHADYTVFTEQVNSASIPAVHKVSSEWTLGKCGPRAICSQDNAICDSGHCVCQSGWIEKKKHCVRSVCKKPDLQFQCDDGNACVAIYDVCNGISECNDESDEASCVNVTSTTMLKKNNIKLMHTKPSAPTSKSLSFDRQSESKISPVNLIQLRERLLNKMHQHTSMDPEVNKYAESSYTPEYELDSLNDGRQRESPSNYFSLPTADLYSRRLQERFSKSPSLYSSDDSSDISQFVLKLKQPRQRLEDVSEIMEDSPSRHRGGRYLRPSVIDTDEYDGEEIVPQITHSRLHYSPLGDRHSILGLEVDDQENIQRPSSSSRYRKPDEFHEETERKPLSRLGDRVTNARRHFQRRKLVTSFDNKEETKMTLDPEAISSKPRKNMESKSMSEGVHRILPETLIGQNRIEWHMAAILLAIGLGLTSCLFGILVGRCRARSGSFTNDRSKAVATSRLRRRILQSRGLADGTIEKDGLLSRLQL